MIDTLYIEESIHQHPRTIEICERFHKTRKIICERYGEVFNPKAQNFRLQKKSPALILAEKHKGFALPAPLSYAIGAKKNYYFSHMLNCLYDCRYCFLQGMYQSANYVFFVNFEDFQQDIKKICNASPDEAIHFFSGYDCDSLVLEPVTGFAQSFLPFFAEIPNAWLELRTKSTQISSLLNSAPFPRCIVAFSLSPDEIVTKVEDKTPTLDRRLVAMSKIQDQGWLLGLRFDPLIYQTGYQQQYKKMFEQVFSTIKVDSIHSVNLGIFRLPEKYFKKMRKLYPEEKLFASPLETNNKITSYQSEIEQEMMQYCSEQLLTYIPEDRFFPCSI